MTKTMRATSSSTHPAYRPDIDGMRALAVIGVVIFHAFPSRLQSGFVGVDVFFVISGFLIGSILLKSFESEKFSFTDFYARRIRRIFPALIVVLLSCLVFGYFALLPDEYVQLGKHVTSGAGFIANFAYWNESGYFDTAAETKPLLHLWSLAIEEQFYLIWPILLWLTWRFRSSFIVLTVLIMLVSFVVNIYQTATYQPTAFFLLPSRAWELLAGSALAWLSFRGKSSVYSSRPVEHISSIIGISLIAVPMFLPIPQASFPGWYAIAPILGAVLVIAAGPSAVLNKLFLSNRVVVWIGLISFPLYLWHWPLLSFARIIEGKTPDLYIRISAVFLSLLLAALTYLLIEKPIRRIGKRVNIVAYSSTILVIIGVIGYCIYLYFPTEERKNRNIASTLSEATQQCDLLFPEWRKKTDSPCRLQKASGNQIALIGDSHAGHLFVGLSEGAAEQGVAVFAASCAAPFIDTATAQKNEKVRHVRESAPELINSAYEYILNDSDIKTVILAHHPGCSYDDAVDLQRAEEHSYLEALNAGMRRTFSSLSEHGKRVIVVLDNPALPFDPDLCRSRPFKISDDDKTCSFPRSNHENNKARQNYEKLIIENAEKYKNITIVNLGDEFCDEETCFVDRSGSVLYRDRNHLTHEGSRIAADMLMKGL